MTGLPVWAWIGGGILALLLLVVLLVIAAVVVLYWIFKNAGNALNLTGAFGPTVTERLPSEHHPWDRPFARTGDEDLEFAIRLKGKVYRWHSRAYVYEHDDFHKTFEDGPWKWSAQGRF